MISHIINLILDRFLSCSLHVSSYSFGDMFLKKFSPLPFIFRPFFCLNIHRGLLSENHPPNFQTQRLQEMKFHLHNKTVLVQKRWSKRWFAPSTGLDGFGVLQPVLDSLFSIMLVHLLVDFLKSESWILWFCQSAFRSSRYWLQRS